VLVGGGVVFGATASIVDKCQSDTSQWPPLAEPTRRKRPCALSLLICLNTARFDMPNTEPSCSVVIDESSLISVSI